MVSRLAYLAQAQWGRHLSGRRHARACALSLLIQKSPSARSDIAKAKAKGVYKGGKKKINVEEIKRLKAEGYGATKIAKELNIHRDSVYRLLKKWSIKYNSFLAVELSGSGAMQPLISKQKKLPGKFTLMPQLSLQRQLSKKKSLQIDLQGQWKKFDVWLHLQKSHKAA